MRNAYLLRSLSGRLALSKEILEQLNLDRNCVLYGVPEVPNEDEDVTSVVLSTLPVQSWTGAYKLIICTAGSHGQIHKAAQVLSRHQINVLSMWAAAFSQSGETCITAIVEFPHSPEVQSVDEHVLERKLEHDLEGAACLSRSPMFEGVGALKRVRLTRLCVLGKLATLYGARQHERVEVRDWTVDLQEVKALSAVLGWQSRVLVNTDTEERYVRLIVVPEEKDCATIAFQVNISSPGGSFSGYTEKAVGVLAEQRINIYAARTLVTSKSQAEVSPAVPMEVASFSFVCDVRRYRKMLSNDRATVDLRARIHDDMSKHAAQHGSIIDGVQSSFTLSPIGGDLPFVFLATNAKPGMPKKYIDMTLRVIRILQSKRLQPVNVDMAIKDSLRLEITRLIDLCPMLVSLHLPEESNRLVTQAGEAAYAPSDWTTFEEAYAVAKGDRQVARLSHKDMFLPRFSADILYASFDEDSFDDAMVRFDKKIELALQDSEYRATYKRCAETARNSTHAWMLRDIEGWLLGRERRQSQGARDD